MAKTIWNDNPNYTYSHKTFKNGQWTYHTTNNSIRRYKKNQKKKRREAKRAEKELRKKNNPSSLFPNRQPSEAEYVAFIITMIVAAVFFILYFAIACPIPTILFVLWRVCKRKSNNK